MVRAAPSQIPRACFRETFMDPFQLSPLIAARRPPEHVLFDARPWMDNVSGTARRVPAEAFSLLHELFDAPLDDRSLASCRLFSKARRSAIFFSSSASSLFCSWRCALNCCERVSESCLRMFRLSSSFTALTYLLGELKRLRLLKKGVGHIYAVRLRCLRDDDGRHGRSQRERESQGS